ncbi:MAG: hypothetical protein FWD28_09970 [Treponema sp.]|nr:hypothetical protein [Treponema sp.]
MSLSRQYSFWGSLSPLGGLTGAGLLIMASARLSWAITVAGGLFWVYGFSAFVYSAISTYAVKILPEKGRAAIYTCIASFFGSIYLLLFWLLCPFAALENFLLLLLVPLFCACSGISENPAADIFENVSDSVSQAASLSGLLIIFSIVREPLSYCSLSFPGTSQGIVTIMYFTEGAFLPIGIFSHSAGALILLGFIICLYQSSKGNRGE